MVEGVLAERLNNIASDLLILSDLESGKTPVAVERISARAAIETAVRAAEGEASRPRVGLVCGKVEDAEVAGERTYERDSGGGEPVGERVEVHPSASLLLVPWQEKGCCSALPGEEQA